MLVKLFYDVTKNKEMAFCDVLSLGIILGTLLPAKTKANQKIVTTFPLPETEESPYSSFGWKTDGLPLLRLQKPNPKTLHPIINSETYCDVLENCKKPSIR